MLRWNCKNGWDMRHQIIKVYLDAIYTFQKRLTSLNLRGTNQGNLVLEPLAVQHLDNRLYIKRSMLVASGWTPNAFNLRIPNAFSILSHTVSQKMGNIPLLLFHSSSWDCSSLREYESSLVCNPPRGQNKIIILRN